MPETYTTEQIMLLVGASRKEVYSLDNRLGWSTGILKPSHKDKRYDAGKVQQYLIASAITEQAQRLRGYGKHARLLWPVTDCPICKKPASFIRTSIFCIEGHYTER